MGGTDALDRGLRFRVISGVEQPHTSVYIVHIIRLEYYSIPVLYLKYYKV
jgi:hypothetical protein